MKYLFLAPPATGELQPVYAITEALLEHDDTCEVHIASGSSFQHRFEQFQGSLAADTLRGRLFRIDLGTTDDVEDYSARMLRKDDGKRPDLFGSHRHARGDPTSFFDYWEAFAAGSVDDRLATIRKVVDIIGRLRPDMIIVDQIYGTPFDAVRSTGLPFILLAPGHPSFLANANPFREPIPMSGVLWDNSYQNIAANLYTIYRLARWAVRSQWAADSLRIRRKILGFKSLGTSADCAITPPAELVSSVCAVIACNLDGLHFYKHFPPKIRFVGSCSRSGKSRAPEQKSEIGRWMDEAARQKEVTIFVSFGSMFPFTPEDHENMIRGVQAAHDAHPHFRVLWKIVKTDDPYPTELPSFVREVDWVPSVEEVYSHPATKIVVHHGGGNTANEVIAHGLLHLAVPQWIDTYDWAATIQAFGLGVQTDNPGPSIDPDQIKGKLLKLLREPEFFAKDVDLWQRKAREAKGTLGAIAIIEEQTQKHREAYLEYFETIKV